ncbi:hypothetical protein [Peribacillus asahii]|uniref:hypothetical protein n=1 Tax=Peribacillus asahii TaxID=228899 RepID=UPI00207AF9AD|nr:hypothetical protein [Peribacillus asahii]USK72265.1 hypothetical protein LIS76_11185 [Peribacillus asahii]
MKKYISADEGTTAKYLKSYEVMHPLFEIDNDPLITYENKLYIEWGKAAVKWSQKGTNEKIITQLVNTSQFVFPGYENCIGIIKLFKKRQSCYSTIGPECGTTLKKVIGIQRRRL